LSLADEKGKQKARLTFEFYFELWLKENKKGGKTLWSKFPNFTEP
jgi:hypothetical protein